MMDYHAPRVRVRFAPSPTGALHLGGLRTALFNYFFARKHEGVFVLRIEDTDQARFSPEAEENILSGLLWAGVEPDEGPQEGGRYKPYRQSERLLLYAVYAQRLVDQGHAYYAFDTPEEIAAMRKRFATKENPSPKYDASTRGEMANSLVLPPAEVCRRLDRGDEHVIRMKVEPGERIAFEDRIRGPVSFASEDIDDQVLIKSDGMPTYHLAHVVDDRTMWITHVIRGEEWLSSTPKHLLLYRYLGWDAPEMAHMPLIMNPGGKGKLSKRHAQANGLPVTVEQCRDAGYEPEAVVNFLARLGWNPGDDQALLSLDEMAERFSLDRVGGGGVQFDVDKLGWFNQQFLRTLSVGGLLGRAAKWGGTDLHEKGTLGANRCAHAVSRCVRQRPARNVQVSFPGPGVRPGYVRRTVCRKEMGVGFRGPPERICGSPRGIAGFRRGADGNDVARAGRGPGRGRGPDHSSGSTCPERRFRRTEPVRNDGRAGPGSLRTPPPQGGGQPWIKATYS